MVDGHVGGDEEDGCGGEAEAEGEEEGALASPGEAEGGGQGEGGASLVPEGGGEGEGEEAWEQDLREEDGGGLASLGEGDCR